MVARVVALLAAVAMVAGALVVRSRIDDRTARTGTTLRLVCATELAAVCDALGAQGGARLEATVEAATTTADRLIGLAPGLRPPLDGWLVTAPWITIVAESRDRAGREPLLLAGGVLARSPVVLAVRADRNAALTAQCKGEPGWRCLGEVAGMGWDKLPGGSSVWGTVKPGHPPESTATGLAVVGAATAAYFGRADLSTADLEDDGFSSWLSRLEQATPQRPVSPFQTMLQRPTAFDAVGTIEAEAGPLLLTARALKPVLLYPAPVATADVVLGTTGGRAAELLASRVAGRNGRRALAASGWRVAGEAPVAGIATTRQLPATSNLPEPGVLDALRRTVAQAGR